MRRFLTGTMVHQGSPWFTMVHPKNSENCCLTMFQLHPGGPLPLILAYQASAAQRRRDRQMQCIRDVQVAQNVIQHLTRHDSTWLDMTRHVASCESPHDEHLCTFFAATASQDISSGISSQVLAVLYVLWILFEWKHISEDIGSEDDLGISWLWSLKRGHAAIPCMKQWSLRWRGRSAIQQHKPHTDTFWTRDTCRIMQDNAGFP